jgi:uncharacterized protein
MSHDRRAIPQSKCDNRWQLCGAGVSPALSWRQDAGGTPAPRASHTGSGATGRTILLTSCIVLGALVVQASGLLAAETAAPQSASAADAPIADAAKKADWPRVRALLADRAGAVTSAQPDGATALHWAAYHDDLETAKLLLAAGASPKAENRYGVTPLSLACTNGNAELVKALLTAGADPNTTLGGGETALMTAARTGRVDAVRALCDAGAKVDAVDRKGQTALMWAAHDGHAAVVELLIKSGADIRARLKSGFTPMLFAARQGRSDVVRVLLKAGVDVNESIKSGQSALLLAVENGHFDLAMELLKAGANPNDERSGFAPLHVLTRVRKPNLNDAAPPAASGTLTSLQFARQLVASGAEVNKRLAKGKGDKLNLKGATPFLLAAQTADLPYMRLLIELGADPLLPNEDGCTPLMFAAGMGSNARADDAGTEPQALAAVEYLLSRGDADINAVDQNGETAMHAAAYRGSSKMVQYLADHGAKIEIWNRKNKRGWTPLLIAQGFRPGNFVPSPDAIEAIERLMRAAGVTPPPPPLRSTTNPAGYDDAGSGK